MKKELNTIRKITRHGMTVYKNQHNELHREDGPAIECQGGAKYWYRNSKLHREGGPAVEETNGLKEWYYDGKLHREDGPAVEEKNGVAWWFLHGRSWPEGPEVFAARTREKRRQEDLNKAIDACHNGLPYDLPVGKPFRLKPKGPSR